MGASLSSALDREPGAGLTKQDADRLKRRFQKLSGGASVVSVQQFETIPELAGNPFLPRLFQMFDADKDSKLTQAEFNSAIDYFLKAQTPEDRIKFAFDMFDVSGSGCVGEEDLVVILSKGAGSNMSPQQLQTVVRSTILEYDRDGDGRLDLQEFSQLISQADLDACILP